MRPVPILARRGQVLLITCPIDPKEGDLITLVRGRDLLRGGGIPMTGGQDPRMKDGQGLRMKGEQDLRMKGKQDLHIVGGQDPPTANVQGLRIT